MKLISKVTEIYCIADDFCKEYELELNKKALSLSNPSPNTPKTRNRKGRMSDAEMITILVLSEKVCMFWAIPKMNHSCRISTYVVTL